MKLTSVFEEIRGPPVIRMAIWMLGEFAESKAEVNLAFETIKDNFGSTPLQATSAPEEESKEVKGTSAPQVKTETVILPDGSYSTKTIYLNEPVEVTQSSFLRKAILKQDDDYMGNFIAIALCKLILKSKKQLQPTGPKSTEAILILCQLLRRHERKGCDPESR